MNPARGGAPAPLLIVGGAMLWGTTGTSQALLGPSVSSVAVGGLRLLIGTTVLMAAALLKAPRAVREIPRRVPWRWLLAGGLGVAGYQLTFFAGVQRTGVAVGTLIMLTTAPVVAGLLGWLVQRERPGVPWAIGTAVALAGCALLVLGAGASVRGDVGGVLLSVAAGAFFALYVVAGRGVMSRTQDGLAATAWVFLVGLPVVVVPLLWSDLSWAASPRSAVILAWLGIVATAVAYLLYQAGLGGVSAATAATLALAEPLTASVLSVVVLHQPLTPLSLAGIGMVLLGLAGVGVVSSRRRRPARRDPLPRPDAARRS